MHDLDVYAQRACFLSHWNDGSYISTKQRKVSAFCSKSERDCRAHTFGRAGYHNHFSGQFEVHGCHSE
jgi:hypothetical protein